MKKTNKIAEAWEHLTPQFELSFKEFADELSKRVKNDDSKDGDDNV